ncbi:MAG: ComEA family DNA-binding protein [Desulfomonilaceae bacterium]
MIDKGSPIAAHSSIRGLIILGLALSLVLMISRALKQSYWEPMTVKGEGDCAYQVTRGKTLVGTIRFHAPASVSDILEALGIPSSQKVSGEERLVPCDSAIVLDGDGGNVRWEPLSASVLVAIGGKIDLNSAQMEDLMLVPGVGPKLASAIVDYRAKHGPFHSLGDLEKIPGVGGKKRAKMEPFLKITPLGHSQR